MVSAMRWVSRRLALAASTAPTKSGNTVHTERRVRRAIAEVTPRRPAELRIATALAGRARSTPRRLDHAAV